MPHAAALRIPRFLRVASWHYHPAPPSNPKNDTPKLVAVTAMETPSRRPRTRRRPPPSLNAKPNPRITMAKMHSALATGPVKLASTWFKGPSQGRGWPLAPLAAARATPPQAITASQPANAGNEIAARLRNINRAPFKAVLGVNAVYTVINFINSYNSRHYFPCKKKMFGFFRE